MTNGRELLELAAKAAGSELEFSKDGHEVGRVVYCDVNDNHTRMIELWNPREDDGDALRLAVRLGLTVTNTLHPRVGETIITFPDGRRHTRPHACYASPEEATRHAIFRAAVEIGKAMGDGDG